MVSLHLQFCGPSYGIFSKNGQIGSSSKFLVSLVLNRIGDLICASNLVRLEAELGSVFPIKNVLLCQTFPMVLESGHSDLSRISYGHLNNYCSFGHFSRSRLELYGFNQFLG